MSSWWNRSNSFLTLFLVAAAALTDTVEAQNSCSKICVRKEWRNQTPEEKKRHVQAVSSFYTQATTAYRALAKKHLQQGENGIHGTTQFFHWHRQYVLEYEQQLKKYEPEVCQPYWDASADSQALVAAPVFASDAYGPLAAGCLSFGSIKASSIRDEQNTCIQRAPSGRIIDATAVLNDLIDSSNTFVAFSKGLEGGYHGQVHVACGGTMAGFYSPIDPIFFLHHTQIDRLYAKWQSMNFNTRLGEIGDISSRPEHRNLQSLDSQLIDYPGRTIKSVMDISALCYSYDDVAVKPGSTSPGPLPPSPSANPPPPPPINPPTVIPSPPPPPPPPPSSTPPPPPPSSTPAVPEIPIQPPRNDNCFFFAGMPVEYCFPGATTPPDLLRILPTLTPETIAWNWNEKLKQFAKLRSSANPLPPPVPAPTPPPPSVIPPPRDDSCKHFPGIPDDYCFPVASTSPDLLRILSNMNAETVAWNWNDKLKRFAVQRSALKRRSPKGGQVVNLGEIGRILPATPLPEYWIKMNGLNVTFIRELEKKNRGLVEKLNAVAGYLSPCALINNPEVLKKVLNQHREGASKVTCTVRGKTVTIPFQRNDNTTTQQLCTMGKATIGLGREKPPSKEVLVKIIGKPCFNSHSVKNPFDACKPF